MMTAEKPKRPSRKAPPITAANKEAIDKFLERHELAMTETVKEHSELARREPSERASAQLAYFKNQLQTMKWLRSLNNQTRTHG